MGGEVRLFKEKEGRSATQETPNALCEMRVVCYEIILKETAKPHENRTSVYIQLHTDAHCSKAMLRLLTSFLVFVFIPSASYQTFIEFFDKQ